MTWRANDMLRKACSIQNGKIECIVDVFGSVVLINSNLYIEKENGKNEVIDDVMIAFKELTDNQYIELVNDNSRNRTYSVTSEGYKYIENYKDDCDADIFIM